MNCRRRCPNELVPLNNPLAPREGIEPPTRCFSTSGVRLRTRALERGGEQPGVRISHRAYDS
jgi:hypothetical protein